MRKTKFQLVIVDAGALKSVQAVIPTTSAVVKTRDYCSVHEPVAQMIMREFDKGNTISFAKTANLPLKSGDLIIGEATEFEKRKNSEISSYLNQINKLFVNVSFITMYRFVMLNNRFCSVGAFIHEDNKEEAYLKIINSGNESMVDDLEEFLESQDRLSELYKKFKKLVDAIDNLSSATDEEQLEGILNNLPNV